MIDHMRVVEVQKSGLLDLIEHLPCNINMIEIGSYSGESTELFLESGKIKTLVVIDYFKDNNQDVLFPMEEVYNSFKTRILDNYDISLFKMPSDITLPLLQNEYFDFIYIDGSHDFESVLADIKMSLPLLKEHAIIGGHDYCDSWPGIQQATDMLLGGVTQTFQDSSWIKVF
jgi:predicted O-methyltransferase YrrM